MAVLHEGPRKNEGVGGIAWSGGHELLEKHLTFLAGKGEAGVHLPVGTAGNFSFQIRF